MAAGERVSSYPYPEPPTTEPPDAAEELDERRKRYAWLYDDEDIWMSL